MGSREDAGRDARNARGRRLAVVVAAVVAALVAGLHCALPRAGIARDPTLHLSELDGQGDATRRASLRLVIEGLSADERGEAERARGLYARALQIDSGNPYAYLALARHQVEAGDASLALEQLARCEDLLPPDELGSPRVEALLVGLRGVALRLGGRHAEGDPLLARAMRAAPTVWADGRLSARELR